MSGAHESKMDVFPCLQITAFLCFFNCSTLRPAIAPLQQSKVNRRLVVEDQNLPSCRSFVPNTHALIGCARSYSTSLSGNVTPSFSLDHQITHIRFIIDSRLDQILKVALGYYFFFWVVLQLRPPAGT